MDRTCSAPGCNRPSEVRGLCRGHYQRRRKAGELQTRGFYEGAECVVPGCAAPARAVGMCSMHRRRLRRNGQVTRISRAPWEPRFWDKVYPCPITGCWLWGASIRKKRGGYGQFTVQHGVVRAAHIIAYELANGRVPEGLVLDHLCRVTCCVNPDHLEAVTLGENNRRGMAPRDGCPTDRRLWPRASIHPGEHVPGSKRPPLLYRLQNARSGAPSG